MNPTPRARKSGYSLWIFFTPWLFAAAFFVCAHAKAAAGTGDVSWRAEKYTFGAGQDAVTVALPKGFWDDLESRLKEGMPKDMPAQDTWRSLSQAEQEKRLAIKVFLMTKDALQQQAVRQEAALQALKTDPANTKATAAGNKKFRQIADSIEDLRKRSRPWSKLSVEKLGKDYHTADGITLGQLATRLEKVKQEALAQSQRPTEKAAGSTRKREQERADFEAAKTLDQKQAAGAKFVKERGGGKEGGTPESGAAGKEGAAKLGQGKPGPGKMRDTAARDAEKRLGKPGAAPPALGDISAPIGPSIGDKLKAYIPGSRAKETFDMLARKPTAEEQKSLREGYDYFADNTTAGGKVKDAMGGVPEEAYIRMNYAKMTDKHGAMVPRPASAYEEHAIHSHVSLNEDLKNAPVEVRALVIGHEVGGHAMDNHGDSPILKQKGSHIPSEVRAATLDAQNYLEIRQKLEPRWNDDAQTKAQKEAKLKQLKENAVWQQADLKARLATGEDIPWYSYSDKRVSDDARVMGEFKKKNPGASGGDTMRRYIEMKYAKSGEEGMEKLRVKDGSAVGAFNQETDGMIQEIGGRKEQEFPFFKYGY